MHTRLANLDAVTAEEERLALDEEMQATKKRIRSNRRIYKPFPVIQQATDWLQSFCADALRYHILIILAQSFSGKTEYAKSLFRSPVELQISDLGHFPDKLRTRGATNVLESNRFFALTHLHTPIPVASILGTPQAFLAQPR